MRISSAWKTSTLPKGSRLSAIGVKGFASWVTNRLQIISHEDMGLAAAEVITLVRTCCEQAKEVYDQAKPGDWRLIVGTAIRAICRANKSREGVHFGASIGLRSQLEDYVPTIPDWVHDQHTIKGNAMGRLVKRVWKLETGRALKTIPEGLGRFEACDNAWSIGLALQQIAPYARSNTDLPDRFGVPMIRDDDHKANGKNGKGTTRAQYKVLCRKCLKWIEPGETIKVHPHKTQKNQWQHANC